MTDDSPHDRIDELEDELEEERALREALQRKLNATIERVDELEAEGSPTGSGSDSAASTASPYLNAVLEHTEPGQTLQRSDLETILRTHTNVSNPNTVRNKVKDVATMGPFERHPEVNQTWVRQRQDHEVAADD